MFSDNMFNISVLYVEDVKSSRELVSNLLKRKIKTIYTAKNGIEGLEAYKKYTPDIVITDIQMPEMDGIRMIKEIKKINENVQIILITAYSDSRYFIDAIETGINFYLLKPIDNNKLIMSIEKCMNIIKFTQEKHKLDEEIKNIIKEKTSKLIETTEILNKEIIQRKAAEKELQKINEELEIRIKERTAELLNTNKNLEREIHERKKAEKKIKKVIEKEKQLNELKSQFISTVSHEFRTPLASIKINLQLLERYLSTTTQNENIGRCFFRIYDALSQLTLLLDDVSLINKDQNGKLKCNMTKCNFEEYCDGIINELTDYYKDININKCYQYIFGNILIDTKILRHVILNLLSNAIKYSPLNSEIKFITNKDKDNDNIILYIEDKGIGIPENDINMIFEPFHRANNVKNIEGTGLGMSIVKRSLDLCKGKISISSKVNEGTNITLTIPYEKI